MDWNRVEGNWKEMKGKIKEKLGEALPVRAESVKRHFLSRLSQDQIDTIVRVSNLLSDVE